MAQRLGVIRGQALDVLGHDPSSLQREDHARDVQWRGVREHVALGEGPRLRLAMAQAGDAVVEQLAAGLQQRGELGGVHVDLVGAHVLDHADRSDRVVVLTAQLAVVGNADLDAILQARPRSPAYSPARLERGTG